MTPRVDVQTISASAPLTGNPVKLISRAFHVATLMQGDAVLVPEARMRLIV